MNLLAHTFLSNPDVEFRLGNLLADLVKGIERASMSPAFLNGMRRHQSIDVFTDAHPVVHRSRARIGGKYRYVTGILVDVFYDHFLALNWDRYSPEPLEAFTVRVYAEFRVHPIHLPAEAQAALDRILCDDWLGSYRRLDGIVSSLRRISIRLSARTGKEFELEKAVEELLANFDGLGSDFGEFFPLIQAQIQESTNAVPAATPDHLRNH